MPFGHFTRREIAPNRFVFTRIEDTGFVGQAMTRKVVRAKPDQTLQSASALMHETGVGILPVYEADRLIGVVTERDLGERAVAKGLDAVQGTVRQAMTPQAFTCFEDETIARARLQMDERGVRHLLVLDRANEPVGILSLDALATPQ